jgi:hypothetical protein
MNYYSGFDEILHVTSSHNIWQAFGFLAIFTSCTKRTVHNGINGIFCTQLYHKLVHGYYWAFALYIIMFLKCEFFSLYLIHFVFCWNAIYKPVGRKFSKLQGTLENFVYYIMEYAVSNLVLYLVNELMFCFHDCFRQKPDIRWCNSSSRWDVPKYWRIWVYSMLSLVNHQNYNACCFNLYRLVL